MHYVFELKHLIIGIWLSIHEMPMQIIHLLNIYIYALLKSTTDMLIISNVLLSNLWYLLQLYFKFSRMSEHRFGSYTFLLLQQFISYLVLVLPLLLFSCIKFLSSATTDLIHGILIPCQLNLSVQCLSIGALVKSASVPKFELCDLEIIIYILLKLVLLLIAGIP